MIEIVEKQNCCGCHACANVCTKNCISMKSDNEGFLYPITDKNVCINCNLCEKVCPIINVPKREDEVILAYACKNKDKKVREASSSGGLFTLLCEEVISNKGAVFGVAFDMGLSVRHVCAETSEECEQFRGSKYVQSKIGQTYKEAEKFLQDGKMVLFSGTPCQISGLDSFLRKKYDHLILVDIACHGVPSPKVFRKYLNSLRLRRNSAVKKILFRDKSASWSKYNLKVSFENGRELKELACDNIYMKGFLNDIYLRPSCYDCKFKKPLTSADITLADYWGVKDIHPGFDDDKGVSLVLGNTKKGKSMLDKVSKNMEIIGTDLDYAIQNNPYIVTHVKYNKKRDKFFEMIENEELEYSILKCITPTFIERVKRKVRATLNKLLTL
ncbi:Coenzyme F420 hydrogenase/dehydrogenase, beta subunit C-terminal domain [Clostridium chromiireducens]|uniref:F420H2 dehydrogenase subunit F n=1 Tax=Clostridium chromiireducens TaxID=225345 RepID=A0A1V4IQ31_9CLOT|nr:Coenzyme F420 hydrogenase/dehydrogenase, beta subunit C-terminal domain [Clostridium chromiireducens]OPJ61895.1 F420H2 dehydrogenase subunit F [Clostridium chromiireducens]